MRNEVWIVEMWFKPTKRYRLGWQPTVGCGLSREDGRRKLAEWKKTNLNDKFRLRRYAVVS